MGFLKRSSLKSWLSCLPRVSCQTLEKRPMSKKLKIWTALLLIYLIWGATYLAIRYAVETIPPFLMAGTRFLLAGIILYI